MKKLVLFCSVAVIVATVAVTTSVMAKSKMSPLMLANIEALSRDESEGSKYAEIKYVYTTKSEGEYKPCPNGQGVMWVSYDVTYEKTECLGNGDKSCTSGVKGYSKEFAWSNGC